MHLIYVAVAGLTILMNTGAACADFAKAGFVLKTAHDVHICDSWLPVLGALKAAGAIGLLVGILYSPMLAVAAATGLVGFFVGAIAFHIRAHVVYNIGFPGLFLALAAATLALSLR
jgi:hypothetical protein